MRDSVVRSVALGVLSLVALSAGSSARAPSPETLVDGFVAAWNRHDVKGFGALFTKDAHWVNVAGVRVKGRAEIEAVLEKEHVTWAKTTTMAATNTEVRFLRPDVAVIHFNWEVSGTVDREGNAARPSHGITLFVAVKQQVDGWRVVVGQVNRHASAE